MAVVGGCAWPEKSSEVLEATRAETPEDTSESRRSLPLEIERTLYFEAADDGSIVALAPGLYEIERVGDSSLRLTAPEGTSYVVHAEVGTHDERLPEPLIVAEETGEDAVHVVMLLEDGRSLDASASYSGLIERGTMRRRAGLSREAILRARMRYPATRPAPQQTRQQAGRAPSEAAVEKSSGRALPPAPRKIEIGKNVRPPSRQLERFTHRPRPPEKALPESFDLREQYPYHPEPKNQGSCGSCYLVSSVAVAEWAYAIDQQERGIEAEPRSFSAQAVMDCGGGTPGSPGGFDCGGGSPSSVYRYLEQHGVPLEEEYLPYTARDGTCQAHQPFVWLTGTSGAGLDPREMKSQIYQGRPVVFLMRIYQDFQQHFAGGDAGVYRHTDGAYIGGKTMFAIGWGIEDGVEYWLAVNSWGRYWGDGGYFKIAIGDDSIYDSIYDYVYYHSGISTTAPAP